MSPTPWRTYRLELDSRRDRPGLRAQVAALCLRLWHETPPLF